MAVKSPQKNLYEVTVILKPNLSEDNVDKALGQIESTIKSFGGDILNVTEPNLRRFAHRIKTTKDGFYISILFNSPPDLPNTLKKSLSIMDDVLRYLLARKEKENKK